MNPSVIVVGGGPAGLAAALVLGRAGVATLVCERSRFPVDKACGEGLLANAVARLAHFGIGTRDLDRVGRRLAGLRYVSSRGRVAEVSLPSGTAFGLRRTALSGLLLARARDLGTVEIIDGVAARVRFQPGAPVEVTVGSERLRPRLVVAADGLGSRIRVELGLATRAVPPRRFGARQHFELEPWTDHVEVYFGRGVEAYVTPLPDGVNVALLWEAECARVASTSLWSALLANFPSLVHKLHGARATDRVRAGGPFHRVVEARSVAGVVLVGDAAGYVDALTGEGVGHALAGAEILERALLPRLVRASSQPLSARELAPARRALAAACRPNQRFTRWLLGISRNHAVFESVVALLAQDPKLFAHFVAASGGQRSAWRVPLLSAARLPRSLVAALGAEHSPLTSHALRNTT